MKRTPPPATARPQSLLAELAKYLLRGVVAGVIFEGSFLMLSFENRIVRGVTAGQLGTVDVKQMKLGCLTTISLIVWQEKCQF